MLSTSWCVNFPKPSSSPSVYYSSSRSICSPLVSAIFSSTTSKTVSLIIFIQKQEASGRLFFIKTTGGNSFIRFTTKIVIWSRSFRILAWYKWLSGFDCTIKQIQGTEKNCLLDLTFFSTPRDQLLEWALKMQQRNAEKNDATNMWFFLLQNWWLFIFRIF